MDEQYMRYYDLINAQQEKNNAWSAEQAQKAMDWQAAQSATAHQREVADLKAAGLNPVLSAGGSGATTGSGMAASAGNENVTALYGLAKMALQTSIAQANATAATAKEPKRRFEGITMPESDANKLQHLGEKVENFFSQIGYKNPTKNEYTSSVLDLEAEGLHKIFGINRKTAKNILAVFDPNNIHPTTARNLGRAAITAVKRKKLEEYLGKDADVLRFLESLFKR